MLSNNAKCRTKLLPFCQLQLQQQIQFQKAKIEMIFNIHCWYFERKKVLENVILYLFVAQKYGTSHLFVVSSLFEVPKASNFRYWFL